jgi:hypothetical protein
MNPIYNIEMWENLIALLSDSPESPYLCDNSFEFKNLWNGDSKEEIMQLGMSFLESYKEVGWFIEDFYLFSNNIIDNREIEEEIDMDQYRLDIRLAFCQHMLKLSNEYAGNQTED